MTTYFFIKLFLHELYKATVHQNSNQIDQMIYYLNQEILLSTTFNLSLLQFYSRYSFKSCSPTILAIFCRWDKIKSILEMFFLQVFCKKNAWGTLWCPKWTPTKVLPHLGPQAPRPISRHRVSILDATMYP